MNKFYIVALLFARKALPLPDIMKNNARHIRWFLGMAAMLLCLVVCRVNAATTEITLAQTVEAVGTANEEYDTTCASLCKKEDDMLHAVREMGQWGISSTSVTLQGTTGRVLTSCMTLQRIARMLNTLLACEPTCSNGLTETLRHTLSTKRFHSGYYIYYRCQMRC